MNITMRAKIRNTLDREWGRSRRVKRTFTPLGFARSQLPLDLFASMATYYDNNRDNLMLEVRALSTHPAPISSLSSPYVIPSVHARGARVRVLCGMYTPWSRVTDPLSCPHACLVCPFDRIGRATGTWRT